MSSSSLVSSGTHLSQTQGRDKIQDTDNSENIRNEEATSFAKISQFSIHTSLTLGCGLGWQGRQAGPGNQVEWEDAEAPRRHGLG